jgi:hypothetical protein
MMRFKVSGLLIFMACLTLSPPFPDAVMAARGTEWQILRETTNYVIHINTQSIETTADMTTKVWYKTVAKSKEYKEFIQDVRLEDGHPVEGYDKFSYTLVLAEIDCAGMRHRILDAADYDINGKALGKSLPQEDWKKTYPDTSYAALAMWVCEDYDLLDDEDNDS